MRRPSPRRPPRRLPASAPELIIGLTLTSASSALSAHVAGRSRSSHGRRLHQGVCFGGGTVAPRRTAIVAAAVRRENSQINLIRTSTAATACLRGRRQQPRSQCENEVRRGCGRGGQASTAVHPVHSLQRRRHQSRNRGSRGVDLPDISLDRVLASLSWTWPLFRRCAHLLGRFRATRPLLGALRRGTSRAARESRGTAKEP